jgi:hypothetical protein
MRGVAIKDEANEITKTMTEFIYPATRGLYRAAILDNTLFLFEMYPNIAK